MKKMRVIGGSAVSVLMGLCRMTVLTGSAVIPVRGSIVMSVTGRSVVFVLMGLCRKIAIESAVRSPAMMMMRSLMKGSVDQFVMSSLTAKTVPRGSVVQLTVRRIWTTQNARGESVGQ